MSAQPPEQVEAMRSARISEIEIYVPSNGYVSQFILEGMPADQARALAKTALAEVLNKDFKGYPGGSRPAKLVVLVDEIRLASQASRSAVGYDSGISASARLTDAKTGEFMAESGPITGVDQGQHFQGGGILLVPGLIANAALNSAINADRTDADIARQAAQAYSAALKQWYEKTIH